MVIWTMRGKSNKAPKKLQLTQQKLYICRDTHSRFSYANTWIEMFSMPFTNEKQQPFASCPILPSRSTCQEMCKHIERQLPSCKTAESRLNSARCHVSCTRLHLACNLMNILSIGKESFMLLLLVKLLCLFKKQLSMLQIQYQHPNCRT